MIIKSMTRSSKSFKQLINYLNKENAIKYNWNMYAKADNKKKLVNEFMNNSKHLAKSRWKVFLYHEVISLENENLDIEKSQTILFDLASKYIELRANKHLVYWTIHNDTNNPHIHLVISSNELEWNKRIRFTKKEFSMIQKELENYKNEKYKELEQSSIYTKEKDSSKSKRAEQEIKHKRNKKPTKELIKEELLSIFSRSQSMKAFDNALSWSGFELYKNGSTLWVVFENKKYRLKTLGLEKDYKQTLLNIKQIEQRKEKWQEFKNSKKKRNQRAL